MQGRLEHLQQQEASAGKSAEVLAQHRYALRRPAIAVPLRPAIPSHLVLCPHGTSPVWHAGMYVRVSWHPSRDELEGAVATLRASYDEVAAAHDKVRCTRLPCHSIGASTILPRAVPIPVSTTLAHGKLGTICDTT